MLELRSNELCQSSSAAIALISRWGSSELSSSCCSRLHTPAGGSSNGMPAGQQEQGGEAGAGQRGNRSTASTVASRAAQVSQHHSHEEQESKDEAAKQHGHNDDLQACRAAGVELLVAQRHALMLTSFLIIQSQAGGDF